LRDLTTEVKKKLLYTSVILQTYGCTNTNDKKYDYTCEYIFHDLEVLLHVFHNETKV